MNEVSKICKCKWKMCVCVCVYMHAKRERERERNAVGDVEETEKRIRRINGIW